MDANYNVSVAVGSFGVCTGSLHLKLWAQLGTTNGLMFQLPTACIDCMGLKIDVTKVMGSFGGANSADALRVTARAPQWLVL